MFAADSGKFVKCEGAHLPTDAHRPFPLSCIVFTDDHHLLPGRMSEPLCLHLLCAVLFVYLDVERSNLNCPSYTLIDPLA